MNTTRGTPPMNVADMGDRYEMHLEMPGIPKNINIEVSANSIEIEAKCEESKEDKANNWLRHEYKDIGYYRFLELPEDLKTVIKEGISSYKNSILNTNN